MPTCEEIRKQKKLAPCKHNEICNPKTNRCVKKSGKIGKSLLNKSKSVKKKSKTKSMKKSVTRSKSKSKKSRSVRRRSKTKSKSKTGSSINFTVMEFNIWQEGIRYKNYINQGKIEIATIIAEYKPDFVCISENRSPTFLQELSHLISFLGDVEYKYTYIPGHNDTGILSKHKILDLRKIIPYDRSKDRGSVTNIISKINGVEFSVYSCHLDWKYYIPYMEKKFSGNMVKLLDGRLVYKELEQKMSDYEIEKEGDKSIRFQQIKTVISKAEEDVKLGRVVLICGDFNESNENKRYNRVYKELEKFGYTDAYREKYPHNTGYTVNLDSHLKLDFPSPSRIDFIYYKSNMKIKNRKTKLLGPKYRGTLSDRTGKNASKFLDENDDSIEVPKNISGKNCEDKNRSYKNYNICWPSDHRALLSNFTVNT